MNRFSQIRVWRPRVIASLWRRVVARGFVSGPEIFRFGRSWAVEDFCGLSFVKFWTDLHRFGREGRGSFLICGGVWGRVQPFLGLKFLGFIDWGTLDRVVCLVSWNGVWICTDSSVKAAGHCWTYSLLVFLCGGRSDRAGAEFGLGGHEVGDEPSASIFMTEYPRSFQN